MRLSDLDVNRLAPSGAFCAGGMVGWDSSHRFALSAGGEGAALAITVAGFVAAGWWMFRRWGTPSRSSATGSGDHAGAPNETAPEPAGAESSDDREFAGV